MNAKEVIRTTALGATIIASVGVVIRDWKLDHPDGILFGVVGLYVITGYELVKGCLSKNEW